MYIVFSDKIWLDKLQNVASNVSTHIKRICGWDNKEDTVPVRTIALLCITMNIVLYSSRYTTQTVFVARR